MRNIIVCISFLLIFSNIHAQSEAKELIEQGIEFHDAGQYDKAIEIYNKALEIEPNNIIANYEIAISYMYSKDYEKAILYSDKVIHSKDQDTKDQIIIGAYITKGSCLDYTGKYQKAIKLFKTAIHHFGDYYLLNYNLALTYYNQKNYTEAEKQLNKAIELNPKHASSHLLLSYLMMENNNKIKSILSAYYFLQLEPNSPRAEAMYQILTKQLYNNVKADEDNPNQINISIPNDQNNDEFRTVNVFLSMMVASNNLDKNKDKSKEELFVMNTTKLFNYLSTIKVTSNNVYNNLYIPYFSKLTKSEHIETFCYYISQSKNNPDIKQWIENNEDKINLFTEWLANH